MASIVKTNETTKKMGPIWVSIYYLPYLSIGFCEKHEFLLDFLFFLFQNNIHLRLY